MHIGDRFRVETAVLKSVRRASLLGRSSTGSNAHILKTACGWYYRVLEEGMAKAGDQVERIETGHADWPVARVFASLYDPDNRTLPADLTAIAGPNDWPRNGAKSAPPA